MIRFPDIGHTVLSRRNAMIPHSNRHQVGIGLALDPIFYPPWVIEHWGIFLKRRQDDIRKSFAEMARRSIEE